MSKLQHIGLFLFTLLSAGLALDYRVDYPDGSHVETHLFHDLGTHLLSNDPYEQAAP